jgi:hypothetical protein
MTKWYERRIKLLKVSPTDVLDLFQTWRWADHINVRILEGLPADARVITAHLQELPLSFVLEVWHPSFEPVPEGQEPPFLNDQVLARPVLLYRVGQAPQAALDQVGGPYEIYLVPDEMRMASPGSYDAQLP